MIATKTQNKHPFLTAWITVCGLIYIFAYQFRLPFPADVFLYGMLMGLLTMTVFEGRVIVNRQFALFLLADIAAFIGLIYTTMVSNGLREAVLFTFFAGVFVMSLTNPSLIRTFTKWIYLASVAVVLFSIVHFLFPLWFNMMMKQVLRADAYERLMWSYHVDSSFAGIAAYTPNTTFSAAIVFGYSFLCLTNKSDYPILKSRAVNIILLALSFFSIIICSKRGIFVATILAMAVLMFYLYRGHNFVLKFLGVAVLLTVVLTILYFTNAFVASFLNRFIAGNFMTGRDEIYAALLKDFGESNIFIGRGTGATYAIAEDGAHNTYLQLLYDHGLLFSVPYLVFLLYNYYIAFKNKCPISIFVQTLFLVYGMSGNPLYSNMFMIIYIYYVLYAAKMPLLENRTRAAVRPA